MKIADLDDERSDSARRCSDYNSRCGDDGGVVSMKLFAVDGQSAFQCEQHDRVAGGSFDARLLPERLASDGVVRASTTSHDVEVECRAACNGRMNCTLAFERDRPVTHEIDSTIRIVQRHRAAEQDERAVHAVEARERPVAIDLSEAQAPVEVIERSARRRRDDVARRAAAVLPGARGVVGIAEDAEHSPPRLPELRDPSEMNVARRARQLFFDSFASCACCSISRNICSRRKRRAAASSSTAVAPLPGAE